MASITFTLNDKRAQAKLDALDAAASNKAPMYAAIGAALRTRILLCFKLGIDPWGTPWRAIRFRAPAGKKDAKGKFKPTKRGAGQMQANSSGSAGKPLVDSGDLRASISVKSDGQGVTVGTNKISAPVHQFGATIRPKTAKTLAFPGPNGMVVFAKKVTIPARPFLPLRRSGVVELPPAWSQLAVARIRAHLVEQLEKV